MTFWMQAVMYWTIAVCTFLVLSPVFFLLLWLDRRRKKNNDE